METKKTIAITGENNLPELIQDKSGNNKALANTHKDFVKAMDKTAAQIKKTAEAFDKNFPKNFNNHIQ